MSLKSFSSQNSPFQVLCVHGAGAGGWQWSVWSRVLAARRMHVLAPDLLPSESGLAATAFDDYRQQLIATARVAASAPESRLVLIGASLGGLLALSIAHEVHAQALVLVNPMPPLGVLPKPLGDPYPSIVPWGRERSIGSTRRALPDADDATCLYAFRRWRDESGLVLEQARLGVTVELPRCPVLVMASEHDDDVPLIASRALATRCGADFERLPGVSHVGPLLGRDAARIAERAAGWISDH